MFPFFESIRLEKDGFRLLSYHQQRINEVFATFYPNAKPWNLEKCLSPVPKVEQRTKCRFLYSKNNYTITYENYSIRTINKVLIIEKNDIFYPWKSTDRTAFQAYENQLPKDKMIIFSQNDKITDSLFSNIVFFDGNQWFTPSTYLLNGIKRRYYLEQGIIHEVPITTETLARYTLIGFINAMIDINEIVLPITHVEVINDMESV